VRFCQLTIDFSKKYGLKLALTTLPFVLSE